jgi:putative transposase
MSKDKAKHGEWVGTINDPLTELLRSGARALIQQAIEAELQAFLGDYAKVTDLRGRQTVVRNGYLPEREIVTGVGNVAVKIPKVRDRSGGGIKFNSALVPPYVRKAKRVEAALPWLYLRGISTGDMQEALSVLLGDEAKGLSPAVVSRLKAQWADDYQAWNRRDLAQERYVYVWADGIYSTLRGEDDRLCLLVLIGVNVQGDKRLLALSDGYRESKASWLSVVQDLQSRGLQDAPKLAIGDGALGFWAAINEAWPTTHHQRCWVHKTANVLAALPDSVQGKAKARLREIWLAETKANAEKALDAFQRDFKPNTRRRLTCWRKTVTRCWRFMTSQRNTGVTSALPIRSNPALLRFAIGRPAPRTACRGIP